LASGLNHILELLTFDDTVNSSNFKKLLSVKLTVSSTAYKISAVTTLKIC